MKDLLDELSYWQQEKDKAEKHIKDVKEMLEKEYLTEEGYKDETITISYSKPSESTSIDLKKLETKEPELYEDLLNDYKKVSKRAGSYRYTFK